MVDRVREIRSEVAHRLGLFSILAILLLPYPAALMALGPYQSNGNSSILLQNRDFSCASSPLVLGAPISVTWTSYHNYLGLSDLVSMYSTYYPDLVDAFIIGKTWEGRDILCIRLTDESIDNSSKQQILIIAEHHAREVITQEAALYLVWYLLTYYQADAGIQRLLASKEIYVVPCLNPDGMELALTSNPFQRKNMHAIDDDGDGAADEDTVNDLNNNGVLECYEFDTNLGTDINPCWVISDMAYEGDAIGGDGPYAGFVSDNPGGVDLNRNYGFHFNDTFEMSSNSTNPRVEDYKGPAPFSEPETRAVRQLVESHRFLFAMSLHSGTETLLRPWSYTTDIWSLGSNFTLLNMFGEEFEQSSGYYYGIGAGNIGYNCSGEFMDWMYGEKKIMTMGCEIYGNLSAYRSASLSPSGDKYVWWGVWNYFNPVGWMIENVCWRTLKFLLLASAINNYLSLRTSSTGPRSAIFDDGFNSLEVTWSYSGAQNIALASYALHPLEYQLRSLVAPISNVFSVFSDRNIRGVQLTLAYTDQQLSAASIEEKNLAIYTWDARGYQWSRLESAQIDAEENRITATVGVDLASNTLNYFILSSYSSLPVETLVLLAVITGITVAYVGGLVMLRKRKFEKEGNVRKRELAAQ